MHILMNHILLCILICEDFEEKMYFGGKCFGAHYS